ncbi:1,4-alpha-glucan branching protein GlgB [Angustibacter luteus]|uniref:1,4-alpha-glucan branching enzyme GlgB n=1 Tax=Angustibacter luteus TaxID=658456 RepID=A0ABW1JHD5_9ACTN
MADPTPPNPAPPNPATPNPATMTPSFATLLPDWVARQRWYANKGRTPRLNRIGGLRWQDPGGEVGIETWLVADTSGDETGPSGSTVYQVPLTYRAEPLPGLEHALVAVAEHSTLGPRYIYDAPHDPVFVGAVLDLVLSEGSVDSDGPQGTGRATGHRQQDLDASQVGHLVDSRVLAGEQSNTSVVLQLAHADGTLAPPLLLKMFRVLHAGANPDVVIQSALADAGSTLVPRPLGRLSGRWPSPTGLLEGHLALVQEFVPGARDAWQEAVDAVADGVDFTVAARELGATVARVHATLAATMPTTPLDDEAAAALADALLARLAWAVRQAPALAGRESAARRVLEAAGHPQHHPVLHRIHGDLHLGQVLDGGDRGWLVVDFEGEPLRPLAERTRPDLALRDVAGMLRSFDYAAGHLVVGGAADETAERAGRWAADCRAAFCTGYADVSGHDPRESSDLLRALELDKALYEVVYEAGNRPAWLPIPLAAVDRLLADDPPAEEHPVTDTTESDGSPRPVPHSELVELVHGSHGNPHGILGLHPYGGGLTLRALRPHAREVVAVLADGSRWPLTHEYDGVFVGVLPGEDVTDYRLDVSYDGADGSLTTFPTDDPYRFLPTLGEVDLHLIGEGRHEQLWTVLGAHVRRYPGQMGEVSGTSFAVWAPHARGIRLVGDLNHWDGAGYPMRSLGSTGVWELFVPGVGAGTRYKFEITGSDGVQRLKADPMARATEAPPSTASVVTESEYAWGDAAWMTRRAQTDPHSGPMSTYEVHLGSWRQGLSYRDLAQQLTDYVVETGFTHVELMPVMEHPYGPSWGYQVTGYYATTARFGSPDDFRFLVDTLHQAGIGVILDWVPAHFPKDAFALARFDGEPLYEHPDPRRGDQPDWGTHIFDFGRPQVRNFLVANAVYWCEEFHVDGLRVDAVASMLYLDYSRKDGEWLPNEYGGRENLQAVQLLQETNATLYKRAPGIVTIAEESTAWPGVTRPTHLGGLGFGLKWNMGWMHDSLEYVQHESIHRQWHHHQMTFSLMYAWSENFVLPISHDEVVHGKGSLLRKMPGDRWQQLANVRAYLATMWAHPGKQLLFMGSEFAQEAEWADAHGLDWWLLDQPAHRGVHSLVRDMNAVYRDVPALWSQDLSPEGFRWIDANDAAGNVFSFLRFGASPGDDVLACVINFAGTPHHGYRIGLPFAGRWREVLNTDSAEYGGSGVGNLGGVDADGDGWHGLPASAEVSIPPLGAVWLLGSPAQA